MSMTQAIRARALTVSMVVIAVLALGGCAETHDNSSHDHGSHDHSAHDHGSHDHAANSAVPEGARFIAVRAEGLVFTPTELTVRVGEPVAISLTSHNADHDLTSDDLNLHVFAPAGSSAVGGFTAERPGTYEFYCSVAGHKQAGMVGTIVVTP
jgi:plastocyanin